MSGNLGEILKKARALKQVSLREVEKKTKISNAYINQLESGLIEEPSPHKLKKLADYYELAYSDLMTAAGYVVEGNKPSSVNTMLLSSQELSEEEAAALTAFLSHMRQSSIVKKKK
jgi:transcriptional regulator with XRE-family HTH domain